MSTPPTPIDGTDVTGILKDGLVASILGAMAMGARLLLSTEPVTLGWVVRRVSAAAITAALVGYGIQDYIGSSSLRMAVVGACGYSAPEILDYVLKYIRARGDKELGALTKKPNAKAKRTIKAKRGK